jgi:hypothetical protein
MKLLRMVAVAGLISLASLAGCSKGPALATVTGTVTYKGQPLKEGTITFIPADGRSATGKIVAGKITEVSCYDINDGVPVGKHKVLIHSAQEGADMYAPSKSLIPEKYGSLDKSELTADIKPGENTVTFDLQ